jgi:hypothetical protein
MSLILCFCDMSDSRSRANRIFRAEQAGSGTTSDTLSGTEAGTISDSLREKTFARTGALSVYRRAPRPMILISCSPQESI